MASLQPIFGDLFLIACRGIYINMKRNKKNTVVDAKRATKKKSVTNDAIVKGGLTASAGHTYEQKMPAEINGPKGPEPTRYGDWEQKGRCTDF